MTEDSKQDLVSMDKGAQSQGFQINLSRKSTLSSLFDGKVHMYQLYLVGWVIQMGIKNFFRECQWSVEPKKTRKKKQCLSIRFHILPEKR